MPEIVIVESPKHGAMLPARSTTIPTIGAVSIRPPTITANAAYVQPLACFREALS